MSNPTWLSDERIREIKHGGDYTGAEVLALAGEVMEGRCALVASAALIPPTCPECQRLRSERDDLVSAFNALAISKGGDS